MSSHRSHRKSGGHEPPHAGPRLVIVPLLLAGLAIAVVYSPVLSAGALSIDDDQYLTENPLVRAPGWASASCFLREVLAPSTVEGYYQPLAMISLMLDYAMGGRPDNLRVFHRTSLILHVANTSLVILIMWALFRNAWVAAGVGLLFGVHPMTVESVAWVSDRKTLLAALFGLGSVLCYIAYARRGSRAAYAGCAVLFVLALMSKPTTTLLPGMMLIMDFWPLRRLSVRAIIEKMPLFALSGLSAAVTMVSQGNTCQLTMPTGGSVPLVLLKFCHNCVFYLQKMVWPTHLTPVYPHPDPMSLGNPALLAAVVGTLLLISVLLVSLKWTRSLLAGWSMFTMVILPTMGGIGFSIAIASDKYAYLPSLGLLIVLAWACTSLAERLRAHRARKALVIAAGLALLVVGAAEASAARRYIAKWSTSESLARYMQDLAPRAPIAHCSLAMVMLKEGRFDETIAACERALAIEPGNELALNSLGAAHIWKGDYVKAIDVLTRLVRLYPGWASGQVNLGVALYHAGRLDLAVNCYETALRSKPLHSEAHTNLGVALVQLGQTDRGLPHLVRAVELMPEDAEGRLNLANGLYMANRLDEAIAQYGQALRLKPGYAEAHCNLAALLVAKGDFPQAELHCRQAIESRSDYLDAYIRLAGLLERRGALADAAAACRSALALHPRDPAIAARLQAVLSRASMPASSAQSR